MIARGLERVNQREMSGGVERRLCEEFSPGYYGLCSVGGMLSAGTTHLAITPLDVLKVNMQVSCYFIHSGFSSGMINVWLDCVFGVLLLFFFWGRLKVVGASTSGILVMSVHEIYRASPWQNFVGYYIFVICLV